MRLLSLTAVTNLTYICSCLREMLESSSQQMLHADEWNVCLWALWFVVLHQELTGRSTEAYFKYVYNSLHGTCTNFNSSNLFSLSSTRNVTETTNEKIYFRIAVLSSDSRLRFYWVKMVRFTFYFIFFKLRHFVPWNHRQWFLLKGYGSILLRINATAFFWYLSKLRCRHFTLKIYCQ